MADEKNQEVKTTAEVIEALTPEVKPHAYVVGHWVWAEFPEKPSQETRAHLKALGFRWNRKREAWQNACGYRTRAARGYDPRMKYGRVPLTDLEN